MEYAVWVFAFLGFMAFVKVTSLESKLNRLEREASESGSGSFAQPRESLSDIIQDYIGKKVELSFYEDETDMDVVAMNPVTIVDADEKWVLVHFETKKEKKEKLLRLSSINGIKEKQL